MLSVVIASLLFSFGATVEIPSGYYTLSDIASRLSTPEQTLRVSREVSQRAALISLHGRSRAETLAIITEALGLDVQTGSDNHSATLVTSAAQRKRDRAWRDQVFEHLRRDVLNLVQSAGSTQLKDYAEEERLLSTDQEAFQKSLAGLTSQEKQRRMYAYAAASIHQRSIKLQGEMSKWSSSRGALVEVLTADSSNVFTSENRLVLIKRDADTYLIGWQAKLQEGRLRLVPVANRVQSGYLTDARASDIAVALPGELEAVAGLDLVGSLFDGPVLNREAQAWKKSLDGESSRFVAANPDLLDGPFDYLSQALTKWAKIGNREVVLDLSSAAEQLQEEAPRCPAWRFRTIRGVLAPVDLLGFWRRGHPLPMSAVLKPFSLNSGVTEPALAAFYRSAEPAAYDWSDARNPVRAEDGPGSVGAPAYYGIPLPEVEAGWPSFRCWLEVRSSVRSEIEQKDEGFKLVPVSSLPASVVQQVADDFRRLNPTMANFLRPDFADQLRKANFEIGWKTLPEGKVITTSFAFMPDTMAESMASWEYRSVVQFRFLR